VADLNPRRGPRDARQIPGQPRCEPNGSPPRRVRFRPRHGAKRPENDPYGAVREPPWTLRRDRRAHPEHPAPHGNDRRVFLEPPASLGNDCGAIPETTAALRAAIVDNTATLDPGNAATVSVNFDCSNVRFTFGIPRGAVGSNGGHGANGAEGGLGPPGEVSNGALASAIGGTSNNSNAVAPLGQSADPNYQQSQIQDLINKVDELINALRR